MFRRSSQDTRILRLVPFVLEQEEEFCKCLNYPVDADQAYFNVGPRIKVSAIRVPGRKSYCRAWEAGECDLETERPKMEKDSNSHPKYN